MKKVDLYLAGLAHITDFVDQNNLTPVPVQSVAELPGCGDYDGERIRIAVSSLSSTVSPRSSSPRIPPSPRFIAHYLSPHINNSRPFHDGREHF
jgi:hypothetical protein